jgi:Family of unknown function (DUF6600)
MRLQRFLGSSGCTAALVALVLCAVAFGPPPARAQAAVSISFDYVHDQLAPYGDWAYSDRWGEVWVPNAGPDFQPYDTDGYWAYTDDGWTWVSDYEWGDIPFHYGRWVNDPDDGWIWIPGFVWSPAWVVWRSNDQDTGWMAMPPDPAFLAGEPDMPGDYDDTSGFFGYASWYSGYSPSSFAADWVFVPTGHVDDRDFSHYREPSRDVVNIIRNTRNVTKYTVVNNYVVDHGVDVSLVEKAGGRHIAPERVTQVVHHPALVTREDTGRAVSQRMHSEIPRGSGRPQSAPPPSQAAIKSLSPYAHPRAGHVPANLKTRDSFAASAANATPAHSAQAPAPLHNPPTGVSPKGVAPQAKTQVSHETKGAVANLPHTAVQSHYRKPSPPVVAHRAPPKVSVAGHTPTTAAVPPHAGPPKSVKAPTSTEQGPHTAAKRTKKHPRKDNVKKPPDASGRSPQSQ